MILINLIFIILGVSYLSDFLRINLSSEDIDTNDIKLISYNVRQFDLYNWKKNKINRNKFFDFLKKEDPDIICFQEYYEDYKKDFITTDSIISFLKTKNYYFKPNIVNSNRYAFGIATFSKYQILKSDYIKFDSTSNTIIYTDLLINDDTIRVFNVHLQSIKFKPEDYDFVKKVETSIDSIIINEAKPLISKMRDAYKMRALQADTLNKYIKQSPYKVLLCGDFNDTPISYTYHTAKGDLKDAFIETGSGLGQSYNGAFPSYRIDYVLYSTGIKVKKYECPKIELSDHFPVITYLSLDNKN